jgi:uncharacterized protein (DUF2342 family)
MSLEHLEESLYEVMREILGDSKIAAKAARACVDTVRDPAYDVDEETMRRELDSMRRRVAFTAAHNSEFSHGRTGK